MPSSKTPISVSTGVVGGSTPAFGGAAKPGPGGGAKRELGESVKQNLDRPLLLYFSDTDLDARSEGARSEGGSSEGGGSEGALEGTMEEFTRDVEEAVAEESYESNSSRRGLQRGP